MVLALGDFRARQRTVYFTRAELNQLLGLYSLHVIRGVWRDYAIDHGPGLARFSVFRHTHEAPAYTILKTGAGGGPAGRVYRAERAAEAARVAQPRRGAGVFPQPSQPGRRRAGLA